MISGLHRLPSEILRGVTWAVLAALPLVIFAILEIGQDQELRWYQGVIAGSVVVVGILTAIPVRHSDGDRSGPVASAAGVWGVLLPLSGVALLWISPALPVKALQILMVLVLATYVLLMVAFATILRIIGRTQGP